MEKRMTKERTPYTLSEMHTVLEKIRVDESNIINLPSALLGLVNEIMDLAIRVEHIESVLEEGISLVTGDEE